MPEPPGGPMGNPSQRPPAFSRTPAGEGPGSPHGPGAGATAGVGRVRERGRTRFDRPVEHGIRDPGSRHPPDKACQPWSARSSLDSSAWDMLSPSTCRGSVLEGDHVGHIYIRGRIWWLSYTQDGRTIRESARTKDKGEARKLLREREHQVDKGERVISRKGTWPEASAALLNNFRAYGSRDVREAAYGWRILTSTSGQCGYPIWTRHRSHSTSSRGKPRVQPMAR